MLAENSLHDDAEVCAHVLANRPVDRDVVSDSFDQFTGDIPQNVGFAVKGTVTRKFLAQNGVSPTVQPSGPKLEPTEIARLGATITVLVVCQRSSSQED